MSTTGVEIREEVDASPGGLFAASESAIPESQVTKEFLSSIDIASHSLRTAARVNASAVSEREERNLLDERRGLLQRKMSAGLTQAESDRLEYVRWSLDRIEDARHGESLDELEGLVARYQRVLGELQDLSARIRARLPQARR